jgi:peptidoglycan/LPS O-acetylase OafA/YrhL
MNHINDTALRQPRTRGNEMNQSTITFEKYWNLDSLNGVRCIVCFIIVQSHVFHVKGMSFLRESPCFTHVINTPYIGKYLFRFSFQMSLFWMMSGFFCELGLHKLYQRKCIPKSTHIRSTRLSWHDYTEFIVNRLIRIYPLYLLYIIITFLSEQVLRHTEGPDIYPAEYCTFPKLILAFFMIMNINRSSQNPSCAGVGWSLQPDMHGYLALVFLFSSTCKYTYGKSSFFTKKVFLFSAYMVSLINNYYSHPLPSQWNMSQESMDSLQKSWCGAFDVLPQYMLHALGISKYGHSYNGLYPNFDFHTTTQQELRAFCTYGQPKTYFTTITKHAGSFFLGALLYIILYERYQQRSHGGQAKGDMLLPFLKLSASIVLLEITHGAYWIQGIPMFLLLDSLLTMKIATIDSSSNQPTVSTIDFLSKLTNQLLEKIYSCIIRLLSLPIFRDLAPLSFGIYLFHFPLFLLKEVVIFGPKKYAIVQRVSNPDDVCDVMEANGFGFNLTNIFFESLILFTVSSFVASLLNKYIEQPCYQLRKEWFPKVLAAMSRECNGPVGIVKND